MATEYTPARDSQQVLKAKAATPDATDRDAPASTSPRVGAMGAGQAADAAPEAEKITANHNWFPALHAIVEVWRDLGSYAPGTLDKMIQAASDQVSEWQARAALAQPVAPVAQQAQEPATIADVLDALNVFNKPRQSEGGEPWTEDDFISVKHLPEFIHNVCRAWYTHPAPAAAPAVPLTDEQFRALETALIVECERAIKQRAEFLLTGVSTAGHGGSHDTCFGHILRSHGIGAAP